MNNSRELLLVCAFPIYIALISLFFVCFSAKRTKKRWKLFQIYKLQIATIHYYYYKILSFRCDCIFFAMFVLAKTKVPVVSCMIYPFVNALRSTHSGREYTDDIFQWLLLCMVSLPCASPFCKNNEQKKEFKQNWFISLISTVFRSVVGVLVEVFCVYFWFI